jgi:DNA-binding PadR family transcriptional regulator
VRAHWEDQRVAERAGRPRRRYYELTPDGAEALRAGAARMSAVAADLATDSGGPTR